MSSPSLRAAARAFLQRFPPFAQMEGPHLDAFAAMLKLAYFPHGERLCGPDDGVPQALYIIKSGLVEGRRQMQLTPGEVFPVGALSARRPVVNTYSAVGDVFCWSMRPEDFDQMRALSPVFADFCTRRMAALIDLAREAYQAEFARLNAQRTLAGVPLSQVMRSPVVTVPLHQSLADALGLMHERHVGSVVIVDEAGAPAGILTEKDLLARVLLPRLPLETPISQVMTRSMLCLPPETPAGQALLQMAALSQRHIPIVAQGRLLGLVTERDLFSLQGRGVSAINQAIQRAGRLEEFQAVARDIQAWSRVLVGQGLAAGLITGLVSRLNDRLTQRIILHSAQAQGVALDHWCWLALGSEGREEQTIATDQDNALLIEDGFEALKPRLLEMAAQVNETLAACGYPLCKGQMMAREPELCLSRQQWRERFRRWIDSGSPQALLLAKTCFDFRPLFGRADLCETLRQEVVAQAAGQPRFLKQMSDSALMFSPPATWTGGLFNSLLGPEPERIDLKLKGTACFVDAARVLALAHGLLQTGTVARFEALAQGGHADAADCRNWIDAFLFIQQQRLRVQHRALAQAEPESRVGLAWPALSLPAQMSEGNPNEIQVSELSDLERRILKEAFRQARKLQQRLALDYP